LVNVIGLDFDNTLIDYDQLIYQVALTRGLIDHSVPKSKKHIRDLIRILPDGEIEWQKVQGEIYGPRLMDAKIPDGVMNFFMICKCHNFKVYIISHKTEYAGYDETRTNLRKSATDWMTINRFFDARMSPLSRHDVFFESTREEKLLRIRKLGCTHFLDDLEETFLEETFPQDVVRILYNPHLEVVSCQGVLVMATWRDIVTYLIS